MNQNHKWLFIFIFHNLFLFLKTNKLAFLERISQQIYFNGLILGDKKTKKTFLFFKSLSVFMCFEKTSDQLFSLPK